ncbi:unnamed protein product [Didymodactylos carnosus]|uniref:Uncharacterized protein n=1 Tax=Didymodactylos carnosus TaxID=1234261 RepID=A0A8S2FUM8_9BILA|nr:unnamed protein product [Didymodactylos carnosus]CAF4354802.1 unnamed protein product [Didymodactylos carnosus]
MSFCQLAPACNNLYSACQTSYSTQNLTTYLGNYSTSVFKARETGEGFNAEFPAGPLYNDTKSCIPSFKVEFLCNNSAVWLAPVGGMAKAPAPTNLVIGNGENPCAITATFHYSGACYEKPAPPKKPNRMSGGAVILIM